LILSQWSAAARPAVDARQFGAWLMPDIAPKKQQMDIRYLSELTGIA